MGNEQDAYAQHSQRTPIFENRQSLHQYPSNEHLTLIVSKNHNVTGVESIQHGLSHGCGKAASAAFRSREFASYANYVVPLSPGDDLSLHYYSTQ
jgi:hypothetical protein